MAASYFPRLIEDDVYFCGFASPKSYGAASYFIRNPGGNWLTDSPRFVPHLVERFEAWGGLSWIFLTHRDDVADAALYAERFGAKRIIHEADRDAAPEAEVVLRGAEPAELAPGFRVIPVPGHTRGHCVLLYRDQFLFSGDHVGGEEDGTLAAFRDFCWHDWAEQTRSMERLLYYRFEWVLPGHGRRLKLPAAAMRAQLQALVRRMNSPVA
jgi:glyoxylase-like metal-dependent hydrolase (beta-lactamase superfamily II)